RARRTGQHHRHHRPLRRRGVATPRRRGRRLPPGLPADRHRDQHRAGAGVPGQPCPGLDQAGPLAGHRGGAARRGDRGGRALLRRAQSVKAQFRFLSGARAGQVETFTKGYIGLGRHPLSDVRFDAGRDLDVSSRHAAMMRKPEGYILQDLGSRNGTYVNGSRITGDTLLKDGDVIGFGVKGPAVEFHLLEAYAEPVAPPPPPPPRSSTAVRVAEEVARRAWTTATSRSAIRTPSRWCWSGSERTTATAARRSPWTLRARWSPTSTCSSARKATASRRRSRSSSPVPSSGSAGAWSASRRTPTSACCAW